MRFASCSSWKAALDYLQRGAARVVSQHGATAQSAAGLFRAVVISVPLAAWRQFMAERRGEDIQGSCSPQGIVEALLSELRLQLLWSALAELAPTVWTGWSAPTAPAEAAEPCGKHNSQARQLNGMPSSKLDATCCTDLDSQARMQVTACSGSISADQGVTKEPTEHNDALLVERLCMLLLLVSSKTWDGIAAPEVSALQCVAALRAAGLWLPGSVECNVLISLLRCPGCCKQIVTLRSFCLCA